MLWVVNLACTNLKEQIEASSLAYTAKPLARWSHRSILHKAGLRAKGAAGFRSHNGETKERI